MSIVTAVIPCYNAAAFLADALESVSAQTLPVAETLVVDDGSTDDSVAIAERFGARVLSAGGQRGPSTARNLGARSAGTPYVAFLDADDCWLPRHCETLIPLLQVSPDAAAAFGRIQQMGPGGDIPVPLRTPVLKEGGFPDLLADNPIPQSAAIVHRARFLDCGGYAEDMRHAEDYDLWLRLAERHSIVGSDAVTCRYRVHTAQATGALRLMLEGAWNARLASRERLRAGGRLTSEHEQMLLQAMGNDLASAWALADRSSLAYLLEASSRVDGGAAMARTIRGRIRLLPLRRLVLAAKSLSRPRVLMSSY